MLNSTTKTYTLKREILSFSNKISRKLSKPDKKFTSDMTYGMLASGSCLLTDVVDQLHEDSKKVNSVERLTRHLNKGTPKQALLSYLQTVRKWVPDEPVIHIDDSDIIKPDGYKFEALGLVRDGSKSTNTELKHANQVDGLLTDAALFLKYFLSLAGHCRRQLLRLEREGTGSFGQFGAHDGGIGA